MCLMPTSARKKILKFNFKFQRKLMNYLRKIGRNIHLWRVHICAGRGRWVECSYGQSSGHQHHPIRRNPSGPGIATGGRAADGDTATSNRNSSRFRTAPNSCCCFRCFRCRCSEDRRRCKWFVCNLKDQTQKHWSRRKQSQSLDFFNICPLAPPITRIGNYVSGTTWKKLKRLTADIQMAQMDTFGDEF